MFFSSMAKSCILTLNITIEKSGINNITFEAYDQLKNLETAKKK